MPANAATSVQTEITVKLNCGDKVKDPLEVCDAPDFGGLTCKMYFYDATHHFDSGDLSCLNTCTVISTSTCGYCGNGVRDGYEQCDGSDLGGHSCSDFGGNTGQLLCNAKCNFVIDNCVCKDCTEPGTAGSQGGGSGSGGGGGYPTGFNPGSDTAPKETKLVINGKAYPGSDVNILIDGKAVGAVKADPKADFYFETTKVTAGLVGIGLQATDSKGRTSALQTITFRVASGAVTTVSGAYLSPSIDIDKPIVAQGELLKVFGQTVPQSDVNVHFHSTEEVVRKASSTNIGEWNLDFNTQPLSTEEYHVVKATFQQKTSGNSVIQSGFSKSMSFYVGKNPGKGPTGACPNADLNKDKKVNLVDFSILLYYWGTDNTCADQNSNKKVDLIDFSIMLYHWTG
ncbi:hypothetical protein HGA64_01380 [Candidatus Falkowbacteria bacterium]|nr:hypothetical protein [Candidatus Falkowbacteria bacterium]